MSFPQVSLLASLDSVDLDVDAATLAALPAAPLPWEVRTSTSSHELPRASMSSHELPRAPTSSI